MSVVRRTSGAAPNIFMLVVTAVGILMGLTVTAITAYITYSYTSRQQAYSAAAVCASAADLAGCRYAGPAQVTRSSTDRGYPAVEVAFTALEGRKVAAEFPKEVAAQAAQWTVGENVMAELWDGRLTRVDGVASLQNPVNLPNSTGYLPAGVFGGATLVLAGWFVWAFVAYRRARRSLAPATTVAASPPMEEVHQLTPEMSAFLDKDARVATHPVKLAATVLGLAAVIPLAFSVVLIIQGRFFNLVTAVLWITFLGFGVQLTVMMLRNLGREMRDRSGGVYVRASGPFEVKLIRTRGGTTVRVVTGRRRLAAVAAKSLEQVESGTGTVDYLPASGALMEVRDHSGRVLWTRFGERDREAVAS